VKEYNKSVLNILCVILFVTSSLAVFWICEMRKINVYDKIRKRANME